MWTSKKGQFFAGFVPIIFYMLCMYSNSYMAERGLSLNVITIFLITVSVSLICFFCYVVIRQLEKEYLVNIEA